MVICSTNSLEKINDELKTNGRFDKIIRIQTPSIEFRKQILKFYLDRNKNELNEKDIDDINMSINGFTIGDIKLLVRESVIKGINKNRDKNELIITKEEIEECLSEIQPSGLKDILMEIPKVYWSDIGGYEEIKEEVRSVIEKPLKYPEAYIRMGINSPKGILLYGPPGCCKTMIAKAIATESKLNFIAIKGPELFSKYVGDSEKAIRELFRKAKLCSPCVIFFDEIDAIAGQRSDSSDVNERVLIQLLTEMNGIEQLNGVIIIGATNRPDILDKALIRPERFDKLIYIPPPDDHCRKQIISNMIRKMPIDIQQIDIAQLVEKTKGFSGAEVVLVCREAALNALQQDINALTISQAHFNLALTKVKPRISQQLLNYYHNFTNASNFI